MKNVLYSLVLLFAVCGFSQEKQTDSIKTKKLKVDAYIGLNGYINDKINLNKKLSNADLPELDSFIPELIFGFNLFGKKYSGDIEFGFLFAKPEQNNNEMKYRGFNTRLRMHYNLINKENFALTSGLSVAYLGNQYDIYSNNNSIDLNDLEPNNNSGHVNITNQMLYFGPSVSMYLFKKSMFPVKVNAGYEFALTRGRYDSEFGSVINNIGESGNNRFVFGITFM
jgi:hypothetical protein